MSCCCQDSVRWCLGTPWALSCWVYGDDRQVTRSAGSQASGVRWCGPQGDSSWSALYQAGLCRYGVWWQGCQVGLFRAVTAPDSPCPDLDHPPRWRCAAPGLCRLGRRRRSRAEPAGSARVLWPRRAMPASGLCGPFFLLVGPGAGGYSASPQGWALSAGGAQGWFSGRQFP